MALVKNNITLSFCDNEDAASFVNAVLRSVAQKETLQLTMTMPVEGSEDYYVSIVITSS